MHQDTVIQSLQGPKNMNYNINIQFKKHTTDIVKEFFRKAIHLCTCLVPFLLDIAYIPTIIGLSAILVLYIVCEILRLHGKYVPLISYITTKAARKRDENKFVLGPVTLCLGVILTSILFNQKAAAIGIFALALGDGLSSLFGRLFGKTLIPFTKGKSFVGSLTCFIAIFISALIITQCLTHALLIALIGMLIEMLPLKDYDNLVIPLITAFFSEYILLV